MGFRPMYALAGDFRVSWIISTVPLMWISHNAIFSRNQNACNVGNRCSITKLKQGLSKSGGISTLSMIEIFSTILWLLWFYGDFIHVLCLETPQLSLHYLEKLVVDLACAQKKIDFISEAFSSLHVSTKVIHTKYSKHWPYTVAHTIDCAENVKSWFKSWVIYFTYTLPHTLNCICVSLFKFHIWTLKQF
jgi:hypothetical protein